MLESQVVGSEAGNLWDFMVILHLNIVRAHLGQPLGLRWNIASVPKESAEGVRCPSSSIYKKVSAVGGANRKQAKEGEAGEAYRPLELSLRKRVGSWLVELVAGHAMLKEQCRKWLSAGHMIKGLGVSSSTWKRKGWDSDRNINRKEDTGSFQLHSVGPKELWKVKRARHGLGKVKSMKI